MSRIKTKFLEDNSVTNAKLAQAPAFTIKGNNTGSTANELDLTVSQVNTLLGAITGDISLTSFSGANNQSSAADVTAFNFANGTVRSFDALVSVYVNATSSLYEVYKLNGIQKGGSWDMSSMSNGDNSQVVFSITTSGQIQYTSGNYSGFTALTIKFRAIITTV